MKQLRISIVDVGLDSVGNLLDWLRGAYAVEIDDRDPDFVIHSCAGHDVLKCGAVRVAWLGENLQPDFNVSDYAMGFGRIVFGDRYKRIPLYRWYLEDYESIFEPDRSVKPVDGSHELARKSRFCTAVVSNGSRGEYFENFYELMPRYKKVDSGGRWGNNVGAAVANKLAFLRQGKFHLAFENSSTPGYVTEKIMHAFAARTVPIYWGAPDVMEDFNPRAFIDCLQFPSMDAVIAKVRELDCDDAAYAAMLEEPCFVGGREPAWLCKNEIMTWLSGIFDQPRERAYRRNRQFWGKRYESDLSTAFFRPHVQAAKLAFRRVREQVARYRGG